MARVREIEDASGRPAVELTSGSLRAVLVPELGGRILHLSSEDEELLWVDPDIAETPPDLADPALDDEAGLRAFKRRLGFGLWGGDKTWIAPQGAWWEAIPPVDLDVGPYTAEIEGDGVRMTSPVCRETGLEISRRVRLEDASTLRLEETITNRGGETTTRGIWDVTQFRRPMDVYIPAPVERVRAYPEEGESVALRDELLEEAGDLTRVPCRAPAHFKMGALAEAPAVVARKRVGTRTLTHLRTFRASGGAFPDDVTYAHGSSVEVYNSPRHAYLEVEVHSPLATLEPGRSATLESSWRFTWTEGDEDAPPHIPDVE